MSRWYKKQARRPRKNKTLVLDADGVCFEYDKWRGELHVGKPIKGVVEFTRIADWLGYDVVVSTARTGAGLEAIRGAVRASGMVCKEVTNQKPIGIIYVDDRGYRFNGDWAYASNALATILEDEGFLDHLAMGIHE
jgi:phage baseplate assembly protein gpV